LLLASNILHGMMKTIKAIIRSNPFINQHTMITLKYGQQLRVGAYFGSEFKCSATVSVCDGSTCAARWTHQCLQLSPSMLRTELHPSF
jgi:hypothetical protein